jgi:peptide-O-fucosyltransferase
LFASPQCLGYQFEHGRLTEQLCFPSEQTIIKQLKKAVKKLNAKTIFIATDSNSLATQIDKALAGKVLTHTASLR